MHQELIQIIDIAGAALEAEDRAFQRDIAGNVTGYPNGRGGILRFNNERYYQFIVARALICHLPHAVEIEYLNKGFLHDVVTLHPERTAEVHVAIEMKRWMSEKGELEQPGILQDIKRLQASAVPHGLFMVFSANPRGQAEQNMVELASELARSEQLIQIADASRWHRSTFNTFTVRGEEFEFWVAGYEVN